MTEDTTARRFRCPPAGRTEPNRSWDGFFQSPPGGGGNGIEGMVGTGYEVVNDYIQTALKAAEAMGESPTNLFQNVSGLGTDAMRNVAPELVAQWSQLGMQFAGFATQAMQAWMQMLSLSANGVQAKSANHNQHTQRTNTQTNSQTTTQQTTTSASPSLALDVRASLPTRVSVELHPGAEQHQLAARTLRGMDPSAPDIDQIHIETESSGLVLVVTVPPDQPEDNYVGLIVDAHTGDAKGTVNLRVGAA